MGYCMRLMFLVGAVGLSVAASATDKVATEVVAGVEYSYVATQRGAMLVGLKKMEGADSKRLEIPGRLGGRKVRMIADEAFCKDGSFVHNGRKMIMATTIVEEGRGRLGFEIVILPKGLESIGARAFYNCADIVEMDIPDSVFDIGDGAFCACRSMKKVALPRGIEMISPELFKGAGVESLEMPAGLLGIGESAFEDAKGLTEVFIPDSVKSIDRRAFNSCSGLASVRLPKRLEVLDEGVFAWCTGLTSVELSVGMTHIGNGAFEGCRSLMSMAIPDSVEEIGRRSFKNCSSLRSVKLPSKLVAIRHSAFSGCAALGSVMIPETTREIEDCAFENCECLGRPSLPAGLKLGDSAFRGCFKSVSGKGGVRFETKEMGQDAVVIKSIKRPAACVDLEIPEMIGGKSVVGISNRCLAGFERVTLPKTVVSLNRSILREMRAARSVKLLGVGDIASGAFEDFDRLEEVEIPAARRIGCRAFQRCFNLRNFKMPDTVAEIDNQAFEDCVSLTNIVISSSVTRIPDAAFRGCLNLGKTVLPKNLEEICQSAFEGCVNLELESLPETLGSIGDHAFERCAKLQIQKFPASLKSIGGHAFEMCTRMSRINLAEGFAKFGRESFKSCVSLSEVNVPDSVKELPDELFCGCVNLRTVNLPTHIRYGRNVFAGCAEIPEECRIDAEERRGRKLTREFEEREKAFRQAQEKLSSDIDDLGAELAKRSKAIEKALLDQYGDAVENMNGQRKIQDIKSSSSEK